MYSYTLLRKITLLGDGLAYYAQPTGPIESYDPTYYRRNSWIPTSWNEGAEFASRQVSNAVWSVATVGGLLPSPWGRTWDCALSGRYDVVSLVQAEDGVSNIRYYSQCGPLQTAAIRVTPRRYFALVAPAVDAITAFGNGWIERFLVYAAPRLEEYLNELVAYLVRLTNPQSYFVYRGLRDITAKYVRQALSMPQPDLSSLRNEIQQQSRLLQQMSGQLQQLATRADLSMAVANVQTNVNRALLEVTQTIARQTEPIRLVGQQLISDTTRRLLQAALGTLGMTGLRLRLR